MTKRRCTCPLCIIHSPDGKDIAPSLHWRHNQRLDLKRKLESLEAAEQNTFRKAVESSNPQLVRSLGLAAAEAEPPTKIRRVEHLGRQSVDHIPSPQRSQFVQNMHGWPTGRRPEHVDRVQDSSDGHLASLRASLQNIVAKFLPEVVAISKPTWLEFSQKANKDDAHKWDDVFQEVERGMGSRDRTDHFSLTNHPVNHVFARSELIMRSSLTHMEKLEYLASCGDANLENFLEEIDTVKTIFRTRLTGLLLWKRDIWRLQVEMRRKKKDVNIPDSAHFPHIVETTGLLKPFRSSYGAEYHPMVTSNMVSVLLLNLLFGLSHRQCGVMLTILRHNILMAARFSNGGIPRDLAFRLPKTLDTIISRSQIDPLLHRFITCPACHALYPSVEPYPTHCSARIGLDGPACEASLLLRREINGQQVLVPIRTYFHHDAKQWVGRLLCRGRLERIILANQEPPKPTADGAISDILGSKAIRELVDSAGLPFLRRVSGEYRLVFALSVDGFNPFGNREAKQTRTCTGMYLICLNLPLSERQKPENMFLVGVIPGPNKPKEGEVNSYLKLIVNDFLPLWSPGVRYSSTPSFKEGALCKGAIATVVCDGLGARDVSGFAPITSTPFCIYCELGIHSLENFDYKNWVPRTTEKHRRDALIWRDANPETRDSLRKKLHPARYTALLELPYFDPIAFTAIDTMHNLFLGLFQRHCRYIWGMNVKLEDGDGSTRSLGTIPSVPDPDDMEAGRLAFATVNKAAIRKLKKAVLYYLCDEHGLRRAGKKGDLLKTLCIKFDIDLNAPTRYEQPRELELPPLTGDVIGLVQLAEVRFAKGQSIKSMKTIILRCMCFLRGCVFYYASPSKAVMIEELYEWRTTRQRLGSLLIPMDTIPLQTRLAGQPVLPDPHLLIAFSSRGSTPAYSASIYGSRAPTPRLPPPSSSRQPTPIAQAPSGFAPPPLPSTSRQPTHIVQVPSAFSQLPSTSRQSAPFNQAPPVFAHLPPTPSTSRQPAHIAHAPPAFTHPPQPPSTLRQSAPFTQPPSVTAHRPSGSSTQLVPIYGAPAPPANRQFMPAVQPRSCGDRSHPSSVHASGTAAMNLSFAQLPNGGQPGGALRNQWPTGPSTGTISLSQSQSTSLPPDPQYSHFPPRQGQSLGTQTPQQQTPVDQPYGYQARRESAPLGQQAPSRTETVTHPPSQSTTGNSHPLSTPSHTNTSQGSQPQGHQRSSSIASTLAGGAPSVNGDLQESTGPKRVQTAVLGARVLAEYASDRQNMILPPWVSRAPAKAGHPEHGKLSADQWRVLCTINLPITLIRLWGTQDTGSRWYKMLVNFLDLVTAVEIGSSLSVSERDIQEYEDRMHGYLTTMIELYPDAPVAPNHHIALHNGDMMRRFGPTPGYRTFGTERFNLNLQRVNTNGHSGEIEMTMTKTICRSGNLVALIEDPDVQPFLGDLNASLARMNNSDQRGSRIHDAAHWSPDPFEIKSGERPKTIKLDPAVFDELRKHLNDRGGRQYMPYTSSNLGKELPGHQYLHIEARNLRKITVNGVQYHSVGSSTGASHAVVRISTQGGREIRQPAQIQQIFRHSRHDGDVVKEETFVVVRYLDPLAPSEAAKDPYRGFRDFGSLWTKRIGQKLSFISPSQVVCHFARTELTLPSISEDSLWHVLPLDKMRTRFKTYGWLSSNDTHSHEGNSAETVTMHDEEMYLD